MTRPLKPFDLEAIKRGEKCVTRNGREAKFLYTTEKRHRNNRKHIFVITYDTHEVCAWYTDKGEYNGEYQCPEDLFLAPKTKKLYIAIDKKQQTDFHNCTVCCLSEKELRETMEISGHSEETHIIKEIEIEI